MLMAPGLPDLAAVRAVCAAVSKPFNFMAGIKGKSFTVAELAAAGVKRISLATSLYRAAMTGLVDAASEVKDKGTFGYSTGRCPTPDSTPSCRDDRDGSGDARRRWRRSPRLSASYRLDSNRATRAEGCAHLKRPVAGRGRLYRTGQPPSAGEWQCKSVLPLVTHLDLARPRAPASGPL